MITCILDQGWSHSRLPWLDMVVVCLDGVGLKPVSWAVRYFDKLQWRAVMCACLWLWLWPCPFPYPCPFLCPCSYPCMCPYLYRPRFLCLRFSASESCQPNALLLRMHAIEFRSGASEPNRDGFKPWAEVTRRCKVIGMSRSVITEL